MRGSSEAAWRRAFLCACALDVETRKPGNVSLDSAGHGMEAGMFLASAEAAVEPLAASGAKVGERIERAVEATRAAAGCNTNLGILLLAAPLARASERVPPGAPPAAWREALARVLQSLDIDDSRAAFRAIALASPAGLGEADSQDVRHPPTTGLREAMGLAAARDSVAAQYHTGYADVFEVGAPAFLQGAGTPATGADPQRRGMLRAYLEFLAGRPDSHIVRKHGIVLAQCVMAEAAPWRDKARAGGLGDADPGLAAWDVDLKARGLNPGTSADLAVASALVALLLRPGLLGPT